MNRFNEILQKLGGDLHTVRSKIKTVMKHPANKELFGSIDIKDYVSEVTVPTESLRPSQREVYLDKILNILLTFSSFREQVLSRHIFSPDIFWSNDGYILDGHHRWAGAFILRSCSAITGTQLNLPIHQAIPLLDILFPAGDPTLRETNIWNHPLSPHTLTYHLSKIVDKGYVDSSGNVYKATPEELFTKTAESKYKTKGGHCLDNFYRQISPIGASFGRDYLTHNIRRLPKPSDIFGERKEMPQVNGIKFNR